MIIQLLLTLTITYFLQCTLDVSITSYAVIPAIIYIVSKRFKHATAAFYVVFAIFCLLKIETLLHASRLLINECIVALSKWGFILPLQDVTHNDATLMIAILLVAFLVVYNSPLIVIALFMSLLLPFLMQIQFPIIAFTLLWATLLSALSYEKTKQISIVQLGTLFVVCSVLFVASIPNNNHVSTAIVQLKDRLLYNASNKTQFTYGDFTDIEHFEKTATPAFRLAMQELRPMYLKSFIGEQYHNGWYADSEAQLQSQVLLKTLQKNDLFTATQFAQANEADLQTMSIEAIGVHKKYPLIPYELATPVESFKLHGAQLTSEELFGTEVYTLDISSEPIFHYPTIASELYTNGDEQYLQFEAYHNQFSYTYYTKLAQEEKTLINNHFEKIEHTSYESTIETVLKQLESLKYNEQPAFHEDFLPFLLEESKEGYSVHFATVATLLFRNAVVPARYVEGYIITNDDVKNGQNEIVVTSDARHAWTEIYIDWIGWVPIEVTPGYKEKMPALTNANVTSEGKQLDGTMSVAPSKEQISEPIISDTTTDPTSTSFDFRFAWLLLLLLIPLIYMLWKAQKFERKMNRFIATCNKKWQTNLPMHKVIERIQTHEANALYKLYTQMIYSHEPLSKEQLLYMKKLLRIVKKKLRTSYKFK